VRRAHPVLVVGGGPAGLATAIALAEQNIAALVVERSVYDDVRIGEHLQPSAVLELRSIRLAIESAA
jgi:2-polyprenyl-6-methoxyphenol hydroxylase-like FAD-dependent oxidoreductase